jgi:hypothetical protein
MLEAESECKRPPAFFCHHFTAIFLNVRRILSLISDEFGIFLW